ncbi:hypothetical protein ACFLX9_02360 [Chloroflexota bacterium]
MKRPRAGYRHPKIVKERAIDLFHQGYDEKEIVVGLRQLEGQYSEITRSAVDRWVKAARYSDPDLQIWHLLNRRKRKPGIYTNWKPEGQIVLGPYHDPLMGILYLSSGDDIILPTRKHPEHIMESLVVEEEQEQYEKSLRSPAEPLGEILIPHLMYLREIHRFSYREIANLVQRNAKRLGGDTYVDRLSKMSYSTVRRIIQRYFPRSGEDETLLDAEGGSL